MPLQRRIPKRGFKNIHRVEYQGVNVRDLSRIEAGEVTPEVLKEFGLIGTLKKPVIYESNKTSTKSGRVASAQRTRKETFHGALFLFALFFGRAKKRV